MLALTPGVGDIDIAVASELLEAGRTVANGFVTPERTLVIASLSRFYAMDEKIAMGDGRFDQDKLIKVIRDNARDALLVDMAALAKQSGSIINAVMLGAIAGSGRLPISPSNSRPRSATTASRSTAICAASAPASRPRARTCARKSRRRKKRAPQRRPWSSTKSPAHFRRWRSRSRWKASAG